MTTAAAAGAEAPPRETSARRLGRVPLAAKLALAFLGLVAFVLIVNGAIDTWLTYNQAKRAALEVEQEKARSAAERVGGFLTDIQSQLGWTSGAEWGYAKLEQQRYDFIRLLRQTPAITALSYIDGHGKEQIAVSRLEPDSIGSAKDFSNDPRFVRAVADKIWFGPVEFRRGSEPYMTISLAHVGKNPGVTVADVNLKLVWDVVSAIHVGEKGFAYVVDDHGRLIAHPDLSLVLRDTDLSRLPQVGAALAGQRSEEAASAVGSAETATSLDGAAVLTAYAIAPKTHWAVFVEQPLAEALATAYRSLARALALLCFGLVLAAVSGIVLARRMAAPIRLLQAGAERLGAGDLTQRLDIRTGDEIEALAGSFNQMAGSLQDSYETLEAKVEARTKDLEVSLAQQTATADVLKAISRTAFDLDVVLDTLISTAMRLCDATHGQISRRDGDVYRYAASQMDVSPAYREHEQAVEIRPGRGTLIGRVALEKQVVRIDDAWNDAEYAEKEEARVGNVRSMLGVPLMRNGEPIGAFALARPAPVPFTPRQVELVTTFADQAVIAMENVRLFEEVQAKTRDLEESLERQTATSKILEVIASSPADAGPVFEAIATSANAVIRGHSTTVFRIIDDLAYLMAFTPTSPEADAALRASFPVPLAEFSPFVYVNDGQSYQVTDTEANDDPRIHDIGRARGFRSMIFTPLVHHGRSIGVIAVTRKTAGAFAPADVAQLRAFADQAVIAIQNARLFEEVQAKTHDLEELLAQQTATADVLKVISRSAFDLQTVLDTLIGSAVNLCGVTNGLIYLLRDDAFYVRAHHNPEEEPAFLARLISHPQRPGRGSVGARVLLTGEVQQIPDNQLDPEYDPALLATTISRAVLGVPLKRDGSVVGAITLARRTPGAFNARQIELAQTFADQAVIAIENSRLLDEVRARTRELEELLAQQTATADVLKVISRSAFNLDAVFQTLVTSAVDLCKASSGTLCVRDGEIFRYRGMAGPEASADLQSFLAAHPLVAPTRDTAAGRTILSGQAEEIRDVLLEKDYAVPFASLASQARALLGVPLLGKSEVQGAIVVARAEPGAFPARHVEILRTFADQAVIAIENARLFEQVQARTLELEQSLSDLRKTQDRLVQSEKLASLGQLTAGIAHEIKNPLNFVNNFSSLSRELLAEMKETLEGASLDTNQRADVEELIGMLDSNLDKVVHHGKRADSIVKNMLLHSREGSGERADVDVNHLVEEALNLAYHGARAEKPGFNVHIDKALDPAAGTIEGYHQELTRVLLNLFGNGFYATQKRKGAGADGYEPTIHATTRDLGDQVEIAVRDNGTGVPPEVKAKMFNPFFTTKPAGEGTGLGLSLSHDIVVKQHGGAIEVDSEMGSHTEFTIRLPRRPAAAPNVAVAAQ